MLRPVLSLTLLVTALIASCRADGWEEQNPWEDNGGGGGDGDQCGYPPGSTVIIVKPPAPSCCDSSCGGGCSGGGDSGEGGDGEINVDMVRNAMRAMEDLDVMLSEVDDDLQEIKREFDETELSSLVADAVRGELNFSHSNNQSM